MRIASAVCLLLVVAPLMGISPASGAPIGVVAAPVHLGSAAGFSVLAGPSLTSTGAGTVLALDLGVTGTLAGFPPGTVTGDMHVADDAADTAQDDLKAAYDDAAAQTGGTAFAGDLAGRTFTPGLYSTAAAVTNTGTITLDAAGDPSGIFVFQVGGALSSAAATKVVLTNGALANNVYWQVVGAVSLGANVEFAGTLLGAGAVAFGEGASIKGRVLTASTVALANSPVTKPIDDLIAPWVTINGGPTRSTNDTTPSISGTTDEPGSPLVTVTIGAQVLTSRAVDGAWSMSADPLTGGPHDVLASVSDPSQNTGTADQVLTVDTTAPVVAIAGGPSAATSDATPTIVGTTDEAGTPTVVVIVGIQTLTTTAGADGGWSVEAGTLTETAHSVHAFVEDDAGNTGTDSTVLMIDYTVPVLTIDGGADRATADTSPWTYGTTAESAGTVVHLSVGGQTLTAIVQSGGTWGVSAQTLAAGTYTVTASTTDAAQNTGTMTQNLRVGPVITPPVITPPVIPPVTFPPSQYRPDAELRLGTRAFIGAGSYDPSRQRVTATLNGHPARTATFQVRITNRGNAADQVIVRGTPRSAAFTVAYLVGSTNVTAAVLRGTFRSSVLKPGQRVTLTVRVTKIRRAAKGSVRAFTIRMSSAHNAAKVDTVSPVGKVVRA